jgi:NAD(P)-dependent dehydrogenase (short-subunit alcohol dehydrogenase family)
VGPGDGDQPQVGVLGDQARYPHLQRAGGGSIINMGSVSALAGFTRAQDAYTAAKGALISLTKSLAIQFARDKIRCNVIHPGIVDTPLQAPYLTEAIRKEFETGIRSGASPSRARSPTSRCSWPATNRRS